MADAEEGESLAGWLAERHAGRRETESRLATVISVPAVDAEVLPEDDDWTQPPLEELARLAKEVSASHARTRRRNHRACRPAPGCGDPLACRRRSRLVAGALTCCRNWAAPTSPSADHQRYRACPATTALDDAAVAAEPDVVEAPPVEDTQQTPGPRGMCHPPLRRVTVFAGRHPHLRQALGSGFPTVVQALAGAAMAPAFPNSIAVDDIPLLRAGTLEALLETHRASGRNPRRRPPRALRRMWPLGRHAGRASRACAGSHPLAGRGATGGVLPRWMPRQLSHAPIRPLIWPPSCGGGGARRVQRMVQECRAAPRHRPWFCCRR